MIPTYKSTSCSMFSPFSRFSVVFLCGFILLFLMVDFKHRFQCQLCIGVVSKCVFKWFIFILCPFAMAFKFFFVFLPEYFCQLYVLQMFSWPCLAFSLYLFWWERFNTDEIYHFFSFMVNTFCVLKISWPVPRVMKIFSSSFIVLPFTFRSVIHFD